MPLGGSDRAVRRARSPTAPMALKMRRAVGKFAFAREVKPFSSEKPLDEAVAELGASGAQVA